MRKVVPKPSIQEKQTWCLPPINFSVNKLGNRAKVASFFHFLVLLLSYHVYMIWKQKKDNVPSIFLATYSNLSLKIWWFGNFFSLKSFEFEPFFNPLCRLKIIFFRMKILAKFLLLKETIVKAYGQIFQGGWVSICRFY